MHSKNGGGSKTALKVDKTGAVGGSEGGGGSSLTDGLSSLSKIGDAPNMKMNEKAGRPEKGSDRV